jgi:hypothetical protein
MFIQRRVRTYIAEATAALFTRTSYARARRPENDEL